ncbi:MAG: hypothetical protein ABWY12_12925 [Burkholderiales bacterium]
MRKLVRARTAMLLASLAAATVFACKSDEGQRAGEAIDSAAQGAGASAKDAAGDAVEGAKAAARDATATPIPR